MTYKYNAKPRTNDLSLSIIKVALVSIGLLIGASTGLYVAVRTMPLPNETVIYLSR